MNQALLDARPDGARKSLFDSLEAAEVEARQRRKGAAEAGFVVRVERSPYRGVYMVRSVPTSFLTKRRFRRLLRPIASRYRK